MIEEGQEPTGLYRIFGDEDSLLYIGISDSFGTRWKQHSKVQPWWGERRWMTVHFYDSRTEAEDAEREAIKAEKPRYNKAHTVLPLGRAGRVDEWNVVTGAFLRLHRRDIGLTQRQLAEAMARCGFPWHQSTVHRMEAGRSTVHASEILPLSAFFGMSLEAVFEELGQMRDAYREFMKDAA